MLQCYEVFAWVSSCWENYSCVTMKSERPSELNLTQRMNSPPTLLKSSALFVLQPAKREFFSHISDEICHFTCPNYRLGLYGVYRGSYLWPCCQFRKYEKLDFEFIYGLWPSHFRNILLRVKPTRALSKSMWASLSYKISHLTLP